MMKICKDFLNSIIISCSPYQKEEKEYILAKYLIYAVLPQLKFCHNVHIFFRQILIPIFFSVDKNIVFSQSARGSVIFFDYYYFLQSILQHFF